jgi:excisionase family DNA binding protein
MERLLKIAEVVERTALSRTVIYELIAAHELPSVAVGRARRVREADLDEFIRRKAEDVDPAVAS